MFNNTMTAYRWGISRHMAVCQWPRKQKKACGTQVCYLLVL